MPKFPLSSKYSVTVFHLTGWAGSKPSFSLGSFVEMIEDEQHYTMLEDELPDSEFWHGSDDSRMGWTWVGPPDHDGRVTRPMTTDRWLVLGLRTWSKKLPQGLLAAEIAKLEREGGGTSMGSEERAEIRSHLLCQTPPATKVVYVVVDTHTMRVFLFTGSQSARTILVNALRKALLVSVGIANDNPVLANNPSSWEIIPSEVYLTRSRPQQSLPGYLGARWMDWVASEGLPPEGRQWDPSGAVDDMEWWNWWSFTTRGPAGKAVTAMRWMVVGDVQVEVEGGVIDVSRTEAVHQTVREMQNDGTRINEIGLWVEVCHPTRSDRVHLYMVTLSASAWRPTIEWVGQKPAKGEPMESNVLLVMDELDTGYRAILHLLDLFNHTALSKLLRDDSQVQLFAWHDSAIGDVQKVASISELVDRPLTPLEEAIRHSKGHAVVLNDVGPNSDKVAKALVEVGADFDCKDDAYEAMADLPLVIACGLTEGKADDRADYLRKMGASVTVMEVA